MTILVLLVICSWTTEVRSEENSVFRAVHLPMTIRVCAHRGANQFAPENTLAAFRKAVELGVQMVEVDVRKTKDNVNIIMHDTTLKRTTGLEGTALDWNYDDLKNISAGKWFSEEFASEKIPTLEEVCREVKKWNEKFGQNVSFYVDCKNPDIETMVQTLKDYGFLDTAVFYGGDLLLEKIREFAPQAKLMPPYGRGQLLQERIERLKPYAFDTSWALLSQELVDNLHAQGIKVYSDAPYGATKEELINAMKLGIDLIQTGRILDVYEAERDWRPK